MCGVCGRVGGAWFLVLLFSFCFFSGGFGLVFNNTLFVSYISYSFIKGNQYEGKEAKRKDS